MRRPQEIVQHVGRELGISRATFYRRMERLQIVSPNPREFDA